MIVKLLTEHHLEFLSLNEAAEARPSLHMSKWPHCWKSHATAYILIAFTEPVYHPKNNTESCSFVSRIYCFLKNNSKIIHCALFLLPDMC